MGLDVPTNKTPGDMVRVTEAERPPIIGLTIVLLTLIQMVLVFLVFHAVFVVGANSAHQVDPALEGAPLANIFASDQRIISFWLAALFMNLAYITLLYQRYFIDHVTVAKHRYRKWEDEGVQLRA